MSNPPSYIPEDMSPNRSGDIAASGSVDKTEAFQWWSEEHSRLFSLWASSFENYNTSYANPYFDYFYTGQDIQIYIDGLSDPKDILPIYAFGYNISQQKQPIYGIWNYTYNAMLRGVRIISGAFSLIATEPYLLTSKIGKAANIRAKTAAGQSRTALYSVRGLDEDESRINQFWSRNYDSNLDIDQQHLFSIHPPFNFIIKYGLQEVSAVPQSPTFRADAIRMKNLQSTAMMTDFNERLVTNPSVENETKIILENIEIVGKSIEIDSEGNPIIENYTFLARDERLLTRQYYPNYKQQPTGSSSLPASGTGSGGGGNARIA